MGFISKLYVIYVIGSEEFVFSLMYMNHALMGEKLVSGSSVWMVGK